MVGLVRSTTIKKEKERKEKKAGEPEGVGRGDNEKIDIVFRGGVIDSQRTSEGDKADGGEKTKEAEKWLDGSDFLLVKFLLGGRDRGRMREFLF